jgi:uncharacterized protein YggE
VQLEPAPDEGISVTGEGTVSGAPGVARIVLGVDVADASLAAAQAEAAQRMTALIGALATAGIAGSDIRTHSISVAPQYDAPHVDAAPLLRGFRVQNLVEVRTFQLESLGELIDNAIVAGATRVEGIAFESEDRASLSARARELAVHDARAKAQQLASSVGVSLGRVLRIESSEGGNNPPMFRAYAAVSTPIEPGQVTIRAIVRIVWAIQSP